MNFNLEKANFSSSSDDQNEPLVPTNDMINQYNRQYSLVVREVQKFLKESKQSVQRFVAFHSFGVNLNLPQLLDSLSGAQRIFRNRLAQTGNQQATDSKQVAKQKYQKSFNVLMKRMADLLSDLLDCQLEFKKEYFGIRATQKSQERPRIMRSRSPQNYTHSQAYSVSSITNSSKSSKVIIAQYEAAEEKEEKRQAQLRVTLNEKLKPKLAKIDKQCKQEYSTTQNLYRLNEKIGRMVSDVSQSRSRQKKLIELFNLNRIKKIHKINTPYVEDLPFPSTDISAIEDTEDVDSFLDNCRALRKDSDSYSELGWVQQRPNFAKKSSTLYQDLHNE